VIGETEGIRLNDGHCEKVLRHEGLAPVRYPQRLDPGSGFQAGEFYAGHRIDRPVFSRSAGFWPVQGSLFRAVRFAAAKSDGNGVKRLTKTPSAIEMAPALHLL
jgi:hypothetical protein